MANNLIFYDSFADIFLDYVEDGDTDLAIEYITAIINYHRTGAEYDGDNRDVKRQMKNVYPLLDKQTTNYNSKVNAIISDDDFTTLALSGDFPTQTALANYITEHYGTYSQQAVSKRLKLLKIELVKSKNSSSDFTTSFTTVVQPTYATTTDKDKDKDKNIDKDNDNEYSSSTIIKSFETKEERRNRLMSGLMN